MAKANGKMIANNKKAYHDYFILENFETGIALHGTEVKSLRMGKCSIKLLMHKSEINKLIGKTKEKGMAIVPLKVYFKGSLVKVEIGLAKGKKLYDKRQDIAKKDQKREAQRDFKVRNLRV